MSKENNSQRTTAPLYISLIIPHRNRWADLRRCLGSVAKMSYPPQEVIIVDDGSQQYENTGDSSPLNIRMIRLSKHQGAAKAKNKGAAVAVGDYLWFLDSDTEIINPGILGFGLKKFQEVDNLGVLGGEGIWDDKRREWKLKLKTLYPNCDTRENLVSSEFGRDFQVEIISTCNFLVPRSLFNQLGGFYAAFEIGEDKEFCGRIRACGYLLIDTFDYLVAHHASRTARELRLHKFFFINHASQLGISVLMLPPQQLFFLPFIDLMTKFRRFHKQFQGIDSSIPCSLGPQVQIMNNCRKTLRGRIYMYLVGALSVPAAYLYTFIMMPYLLALRINNNNRLLKKGR